MLPIPSVAMNESTRSLTTTKPFTTPMKAAATMPMTALSAAL